MTCPLPAVDIIRALRVVFPAAGIEEIYLGLAQGVLPSARMPGAFSTFR